MKKRISKKWSGGLICLVLTVLIIVISYQKIPQLESWRQLPSDVKWLMLELETERLFFRIFPPDPHPEQYAHLHPEVLKKAVVLGADWILSMQEPSGRFQYWYDPVSNRFSEAHDDNFLRQAGTGFSLMMVYELTGDPRYLNSSKQNLQHLQKFLKNLPPDKAYYLYNQKAKLGGISLPMLTMLKLREFTGSQEYDILLKKLANMILTLQEQYQTGQYKSTYVYRGDYEYEKKKGWESKIYPGEAMLALAGMYQAFQDPRYKNSIDQALGFYAKNAEFENSQAFLPWTISAFTSLYLQTREAHYAKYVIKLTNLMLREQNLDHKDKVYGSFHGVPAINTSAYLEGLADAFLLAQTAGNTHHQQLYADRLKMGYRWILLLQHTKDSPQLPNPQQAIGGFQGSLHQARQRIDNTQHSIVALTKGLRYLYNTPPAVSPAPSDQSSPSGLQ
ncbi:MAG: hypothetical protein HQM14_07795 [SAR324 cluster bacterium]|nr:hypothetical protein [SAR324 cluster bacterium]